MREILPNYYNVPEIKLSFKTNFRASERPCITSMEDAHEIFREAWDDSKMDMVEEGKVLLLNQANRVIGLYDVCSGGITGTVMDIRHILVAALKANANQIIVAHNHPSDNLNPSHADRLLTEKLTAAAQLMDIRVLDHLILCRSGFYSLTEGESFSPSTPKIIPFPVP